MGLAIIPLVVATVRALARGWVAVGDIGLILMRAEDVGTANHPLLGTWTSASLGAGQSLNNPGPLWFDVLAPFVRVAGPSVGIAVGVMAANAATIVLAAWAARRAGGETAMVIVTVLSAGLAWSMGSELLFDAWQPHAMILPFWAFLIVVWALATGDAVMAPFAVGLASLILQTHLSFVYVVGVVGAAGTALAVWSCARVAPDARSRWRRPLWAAGIVALVAWSQPLVDQFFGEGNLTALLSASRAGGDETIGLGLGARLVASIVALPPWWGRSGFSGTVVATGVISGPGGSDVVEGDVAGRTPALIGLLVVAIVLLSVVAVARRRGAHAVVVLGILAAIAVGAAITSMLFSPVNVIGLSPHQLRWLWPVSTLVLAAPLLAIAEWSPAARLARPAGVLATGLLCVLALPTHAAPEGPTRERDYGSSVAQLVDQLDGYRPDGPVVFDTSVLRFAEPYSGPVLAALARNDVDVVVTDETTVRQLGHRRRADGTEQRRVFLVEGVPALTPENGARRIAFVDGLTAAENAELERLRVEVTRTAGEAGLLLNDDGADAAVAGRLPFGATVLEPGTDAAALEAGGWLTALIDNEWVDVPSEEAPSWERYAELDTRRSRFTVGLFEAPLPSP